ECWALAAVATPEFGAPGAREAGPGVSRKERRRRPVIAREGPAWYAPQVPMASWGKEDRVTLEIRHEWSPEEIRAVHDLPLFELVYRAQTVHREAFGDHKVQLCSLLSIKTGGCSEDCAYCPQAARYHTGVEA